MGMLQEMIDGIDGDQQRLQDNIAFVDEQVKLFDGTPPENRVKDDPHFGDALGKAVKPLLFPYCLKRIFTRHNNRGGL